MESVVADKENVPLHRKKSSHAKSRSQSGSLAFGKIPDKEHNGEHKLDDWKKMQNICVIARFRPKNKQEIRWAKANNVRDKPPVFESKQTVSMEPSPLSSGSRSSLDFSNSHNSASSAASTRPFTATLDAVLAPKASQKRVFYRCGVPMIGCCLDGFNATIFAYGQSGSGKTYTMMGPESDIKCTADFGLIPRCIIYLFQKLDEALSQNGGKLQDYMVNMESLQIYKSQVLDLLDPASKKKLTIRSSRDTVFVENLKSVQIQTVQEAFKLLTKTQQNRMVSGHNLNEVSSRSHMLISMKVVQRALDGTLKTSKLNFGDLAGSEDLTKALGPRADPERRREAIAINRSLSALTTAVSYLARGQKPSLRDSPLTHVLRDSLGGNSKCIMLMAASPHIYNRAETIRTLRFASTAKTVKNKARVNVLDQKSLRAKIKDLERENSKLRRRIKGPPLDGPPKSRRKSGDAASSAKRHSVLSEATTTNPTVDSARDSDFVDDGVEGGDRASVLIHDDRGRKRKGSMTTEEIIEIADDDKEWGPHSAVSAAADALDDDFGRNLKAEDDSLSGDDDADHLALREYVQQLHEYRDKLEREMDANLDLHFQIDSKNMELELCGNRIAQLMDHLTRNEGDSKAQIAHLQRLLAEYQCAFPSFKPSHSPPAQHRLSAQSLHSVSRRQSLSNSPSVSIPGHLLEDLLALQQRMESKVVDAEAAINEIQLQQRRSVRAAGPIHYERDDEESSSLSEGGSSALIYESADEKLSEWDLTVSAGATLSDTASKGRAPRKSRPSKPDKLDTAKTTKGLRQHLKSLSQSEKKLRRDLESRLKTEAVSGSGWCRCFWQSPRKKEGPLAGQLLEQYLTMRVRRELARDRYQRKRERDRARILKQRTKGMAADTARQ